ncbi:MAG TPA: CoA transferase, partial [Pseudorhodoferax sp.]|nr:CoA transferase [Pseudorhodoferax sp.]
AMAPHNLARGVFFERDGVLQAVPAPRFDGHRSQPGPIPRLGEHTQDVLARLRQDGPAAVWNDR